MSTTQDKTQTTTHAKAPPTTILKMIPVIIEKADRNYTASSPYAEGCFATGRTPEEAVTRLEAIAGDQIRELMNSGELEAGELDDLVSITMLTVAIPAVPIGGDPDAPAEALRSFRKGHRMTQAQFAARLDITQATVSDWESGKRDVPGPVRAMIETLA